MYLQFEHDGFYLTILDYGYLSEYIKKLYKDEASK
jgi:hypothetical protein